MACGKIRKLTSRAVLLALLLGAWPGSGHAADRAKTIVMLYGESRLTPAFAAGDESLRATLTERSRSPVNLHTEYLDLGAYDPAVAERELVPLLRKKYRRLSPDVVIVAAAASRFLIAHRAELFPGVPMVMFAFDRSQFEDLPLASHVTGIVLSYDWRGTLDVALGLHPDTRRVVVITGDSPIDVDVAAGARRELAPYEARLHVSYLDRLPLEQRVAELKTLPSHTVVLVGPVIRNAAVPGTADETLRRLVQASRAPVYAVSETALGSGVVGGRLVSARAWGIAAAGMALQILDGAVLGPRDVVEHVPSSPVFDARQLRRWSIAEAALPAGSIVRFREPSLWELYPWHIFGTAALVVLETLLIVGLVLERRWRVRAQQSLRARLRFELLVEDLAATFANLPPSDVDQQIEQALTKCLGVLGVDRAALGEFTADGRFVRLAYSRTRSGVGPIPVLLETERLPWMTDSLRRGKAVVFDRLEQLPAVAAIDAASFSALRTRSLVAVPLRVGGVVIGALRVSTATVERRWTADFLRAMHLLAEIFASALAARRAEHTVRESEDRFRALADQAPMMMWMSGVDARCTFLNKPWLDFTGRMLEQEIGEGWTEAVHPEDVERCVQTYLTAFHARAPFRVEYRLRRADGEYRSVLDTGAPRSTPDGVFLGYAGSCVDVTDVNEARRILLESVALRSAIFGSLYGQVAAVDADGVIIAVNEAWTAAVTELGADPAATSVGANYLAVCRAAGDDEDARRALAAIESVLRGQVPRARLEYPCNSPTKERWFEMDVEPLRRPEGGAVVSHIDVTARRHAEDEARRQRDELAHALRVTTLGELMASVSHEINQPLAAIMTGAQAARRLLDRPDGERGEVQEVLDDIIEDSRRAAQVIRRLRALFRKDHAERKTIHVDELIIEVTSLLRADLLRRNVALHVVVDDGLPPVRGDAIQLQQVLLNLAVNAIEAMATVEMPRDLEVAATRPRPGVVEIRVGDTGIGIDPSRVDTIFEPFVTTKAAGLGLGLSISRSIVQAHEGRIWATVNPTRGLTVHVELPCEELCDDH